MSTQQGGPIASEAHEYDNMMEMLSRQLPDHMYILDRVIPLKDCKVVDLGCGPGNYTYRLADRVGPNGTVLGVDPDRERIEIAREKCEKDNLTFVVGDGERYPEDQYDVVFSKYALHWIEDKKTIFERAYENLRPGGQFAFVAVSGTPDDARYLFSLMGEEGEKAVYNQWFWWSQKQYKELAESVGFEVTLSEDGIDPYVWPNADSVIASWYGITEGKFDPSKADQVELEMYRQKYVGKEIQLDIPVARCIFKKP